MVTDIPGGGESHHVVTVNLNPPPAVTGGANLRDPIPVQVEVYEGYYFGDTDREIAKGFDDQHVSGEQFEVTAGDWGVMTIRALADGYQTADTTVVIDQPGDSDTLTITLKQ
jgi:hypothetical protein